MTPVTSQDPGEPHDADKRRRRRRRAALADSAGEPAAHDREDGGREADSRDDELRREVPPHHG